MSQVHPCMTLTHWVQQQAHPPLQRSQPRPQGGGGVIQHGSVRLGVVARRQQVSVALVSVQIILPPAQYVHVCRFTAIACTHTSLLAVDGRGSLCCRDWAHTMPHPSTEVGHAHPRAVKLVLSGECVALMDASYVRATIMTTSGKVMCTP